MQENLNLYHVFATVANTLNITTAAKELFISQPAVSKSISKLEENLGVSLFIRSSKGVKLTYEGELLYQKCKNAFASIEQGELQLKNIARLSVGHISIGVSTTLCKYVLLPYLKKFKETYPHINISISCQSTIETLKAIEKGKVDIGLVGETKDRAFIFRQMQQIRDIFVVSPSYLSALEELYGDQLNLRKNATFLLLDQANMSRQYLDHYMSRCGISFENVMEVTSMDLLIEFVKTDLGIACVIDSFVSEELENHSLVEIDNPIEMPPRNIGFAYQKDMPHTKAMDSFLSFFEQV